MHLDWALENIETLLENLNPTDTIEVEMPIKYVPPKSVVKFGETKLFKDSQRGDKTLVVVNFDNGYPTQWLLVESSEIVVWVAKFKCFCEWAKSVEMLTAALMEEP